MAIVIPHILVIIAIATIRQSTAVTFFIPRYVGTLGKPYVIVFLDTYKSIILAKTIAKRFSTKFYNTAIAAVLVKLVDFRHCLSHSLRFF